VNGFSCDQDKGFKSIGYLIRAKTKLTMKTPIILFITFLFTACSSYDFVIESDYSYEGNFTKYRTYDFAINESFGGTDTDKLVIEKYLKRTLQAGGYNMKERRPNLIVFYTFFYDDFEFGGYNQPQFQGWLRSNYHDDAVVFKKDTLATGELADTHVENVSRFDENYDRVKYELREGTILISLFDPRRKLTVWQGYASGVFGPNQEKNERVMKSAIVQIMDEFKLTAFGAS